MADRPVKLFNFEILFFHNRSRRTVERNPHEERPDLLTKTLEELDNNNPDFSKHELVQTPTENSLPPREVPEPEQR
ncbi:hypothetical protein PS691_01790 [Pseudomonas fluorescens]|uniref:Uncharacterized protein n=1 Tax=Pseudomonas fluorescens TaxID=294 RepID=A0A5E7BEX0_PSEFL|nr:hypothetical protein PS691_01790 [Pseudomonas fluorescens]